MMNLSSSIIEIKLKNQKMITFEPLITDYPVFEKPQKQQEEEVELTKQRELLCTSKLCQLNK